jgi:hypothetical protein
MSGRGDNIGVMHDDQTQEELDLHYGETGPVVAAWAWLDAVFTQQDLAAAWPLMDTPLRELLARDFVDANAQHPYVVPLDKVELVRDLVSVPSSHELWIPFAEIQIRKLRDRLDWITSVETLGAASRPRVVGIDVEAVVILNTNGDTIRFESDQIIVGEVLTLHLRNTRCEDGWLVTVGGDFIEPELRR